MVSLVVPLAVTGTERPSTLTLVVLLFDDEEVDWELLVSGVDVGVAIG